MRLAILADIHGNRLALDAVLADVASRGGADAFVDLGDRVSGPLWPAETMECLEGVSLQAIRGNHDRAVATQSPADMIPSDLYAWKALTPKQRAALGELPTTLTPMPGVLACHGRPDRDDTYLLEDVADGRQVRSTPAVVAARLGEFGSTQVVLCGHSHRADMVWLPKGVMAGSPAGLLVVNPGSVGCPAYDSSGPPAHVAEACTPHARYAVLDLSAGDPAVTFMAVPYDHEAAARRAEANGRSGWAYALRTGTWPRS